MFGRSLFLGVLFFFAWATSFAGGPSIPSIAPVIDQFGLLDSRELEILSNRLRLIRERNGIHVVVFIATDLQGYDINDFSMAAVEEWKLGKKGEDKGLLFLISPKEKKMRLEVGYGLEGVLTDAKTRRILDNEVRPYFKSGQYFDGILEGVNQVQVAMGIEIPPGEESAQRSSKISRKLSWFDMIVLLFLLIVFLPAFIFLSAIQNAAGRGGRWRGGGGWGGGGSGSGWGGSGGGGSWSGGGGGFGGGGSSSSW